MIELVWGKQRILEVYLNVAEMGKGIYGIEAAAETYFGKTALQLDPTEAAMIVACLPNPKRYSARPASSYVLKRYPGIVTRMSQLQAQESITKLIY